jgi:hypothetical protein
MAYDNTHVWAAYNVLTAAQLQQISDNMDYVYTYLPSGSNAGFRTAGAFIPDPWTYGYGTSDTWTANRIYCMMIRIESQFKVDGFYATAKGGISTGHYGAGIYTLAGNLLIGGVSGNVAASNPISITCAATLVPVGMYLLAGTCDATGAISYVLEIENDILPCFNVVTTMRGYTATTSTSGVLPASINPSLTAISTKTGGSPNWVLHHAAW